MRRALLVALSVACGGCQNFGPKMKEVFAWEPNPKLEMLPDSAGPAGGIPVALESLTEASFTAAKAAYDASIAGGKRGEPTDRAGVATAVAAALGAALEADSPPTIPASAENSAKIADAIAAGITRAASDARGASAAEITDTEAAKAAFSADIVTSAVTAGIAAAANKFGYVTSAEAIASSSLLIVATQAAAAKAAADAKAAAAAAVAAKAAEVAFAAKVTADVSANPADAAAIVTTALKAKPGSFLAIVSAAVAAAPVAAEQIVAAAVGFLPNQQAAIIGSARAVAPQLSKERLAAAANAAAKLADPALAKLAADIAAQPAAAGAIVTTALKAQPGQLLAIVSVAVAAAPNLAGEIVGAAGAISPSRQADIMASAVAAAPQLSSVVASSAAVGGATATSTGGTAPQGSNTVVTTAPQTGAATGAIRGSLPGKGWDEQRILYATDRKPVAGLSLARWKSELAEKGSGYAYYGPDPEEKKEENDPLRLHYGWCTVSIPAKHQFATVERPSAGSRESVVDHITIRGINELNRAGLLAEVAKMTALDEQHKDGKDAFIFIHGYNVTFNDAAMRAAQMAYDFNFLGAPILYSWASRGTLLGYFKDENEVVSAGGEGLRKLIAEVKAGGKVRKLHIVAHSMGNRALVKALGALAKVGEAKIFGQVILAAADVGRTTFTEDFAREIIPLAERISLYVAVDDEPLKLSRLHSGVGRLGQGGPDRFIMPGIHTIEASKIDDDIFSLRHSYFADVGPVLSDLKALLVTQVEPDTRPRRLLRAGSDDKTYWEIKK
ncbi:MAG: hypothetical protein RLZZ15_2976 [Verrucomicrobiota bacterium]|jgi:esterase/lipase superfamily enzyme